MATLRRYWIDPNGDIFNTLPVMWHNISPFTPAVAQQHGWEKKMESVVDPVRTTCTKYELVRCLEEYFPALLTTLKTAYAASSELQFYWNTVVELDRNNDDFKSAVAQLGITDEQIEEIFGKLQPVEA